MKKGIFGYFILISVLAMFGCNGCSENKHTTEEVDYNKIQQELIEDRKKEHQKETKAIHKYIKDNKLVMTETKTGLFYQIYQNGSGETAKPDDYVSISYSITLMDGTLCYQADDAHPKQFRVGQDNVESGLHELVQLMRPGDKAKCIMPSHLAFGFTGDSGKIPPSSTVIYDIHLISIHP